MKVGRYFTLDLEIVEMLKEYSEASGRPQSQIVNSLLSHFFKKEYGGNLNETIP